MVCICICCERASTWSFPPTAQKSMSTGFSAFFVGPTHFLVGFSPTEYMVSHFIYNILYRFLSKAEILFLKNFSTVFLSMSPGLCPYQWFRAQEFFLVQVFLVPMLNLVVGTPVHRWCVKVTSFLLKTSCVPRIIRIENWCKYWSH